MNGIIMEARSLSYAYRSGASVLDDVTMRLERGEFLGIVGPNGVGKSTALKVLCGFLRPAAGEVRLAGALIGDMSNQERARRLAIVPQNVYAPVPFTVEEVVRMGRRARLSRFSRLSEEDHRVIEQTVVDFDLTALSDRPIGELSGGERQRAMIAAAVAQEPEVLLLDEPTSHLDIGNSARVIQSLMKWRIERNASILLVTHDVQMAARCCDRIVMLKDGRVMTEGQPSAVLSAELLQEVYGRGVVMYESPWDNLPVVLPELTFKHR